jgi:hypothetical protein
VRAPLLAGQPDACRRIAWVLARDPAYERVSVRPGTGSVFATREDGAIDAEDLASHVSGLVEAERDAEGEPLVGRSPRDVPGPTRVAHAVAHAVSQINADVSAALDHRADLGTLLPVAFAIGGVVEVSKTGKLPVPTWFNLLWWSLRSFMTFNVRAIESEVSRTASPPSPAERELEHDQRVR